MSRIEEMIKELCPNGVDHKPLGEIGNFYGGLTGKGKDDFKEGNAKFISYMNVYSNPSLDLNIDTFVKIAENEKQNRVQYSDILFTGSSETPDECGMSSVVTQYVEEDLYLNSFCFGYRLNEPSLFNPYFLKHLFRSFELRQQIALTASGVTRFNVSKKRFAKISIPVPPIEIQNEIVNILDKFTELEAELEAELEVRLKQYEYYRNKLLNFSKFATKRINVKWLTMSEICKIYSGRNKSRNEIGQYPVYGSTGIIAYCNEYVYNTKQILIARVGANAGYVHIANGEYDVSDNTLIVDIKKGFNLQYIYYILVNINLKRYAKGGGQPLVTAGEIKQIQIPLPPIEEQQRIVEILDKFEILVNDISEGLPAEIAARRQQYEYYRDKLLTFPKISA